jgi:hypothetical protein
MEDENLALKLIRLSKKKSELNVLILDLLWEKIIVK